VACIGGGGVVRRSPCDGGVACLPACGGGGGVVAGVCDIGVTPGRVWGAVVVA